jgi:hypothetical protein
MIIRDILHNFGVHHVLKTTKVRICWAYKYNRLLSDFFYFNNDTLYISLVHCEANKTNIKYKMKEFT